MSIRSLDLCTRISAIKRQPSLVESICEIMLQQRLSIRPDGFRHIPISVVIEERIKHRKRAVGVFRIRRRYLHEKCRFFLNCIHVSRSGAPFRLHVWIMSFLHAEILIMVEQRLRIKSDHYGYVTVFPDFNQKQPAERKISADTFFCPLVLNYIIASTITSAFYIYPACFLSDTAEATPHHRTP